MAKHAQREYNKQDEQFIMIFFYVAEYDHDILIEQSMAYLLSSFFEQKRISEYR